MQRILIPPEEWMKQSKRDNFVKGDWLACDLGNFSRYKIPKEIFKMYSAHQFQVFAVLVELELCSGYIHWTRRLNSSNCRLKSVENFGRQVVKTVSSQILGWKQKEKTCFSMRVRSPSVHGASPRRTSNCSR